MAERMPWSRRRELLEMPPEAPVRIWSFQHPAALDAARARGWLSGDHGHTGAGDAEEMRNGNGFWRAYGWMRGRKAERIPGFSGEAPVWAWVKRPSAKPMDAWRTDVIRITASVPRGRMLLSDEDAWHAVLNGRPYSLTEAESDTGTGSVGAFATSPTWERIFDLSPRTGEQALWCGQPEYVQACVDRIYLNEILAVRTMPRKPPR